MGKRERPLSHCVKDVWVPVRHSIIQNDICTNGNELTTIILSEGVGVYLVLQSASSIVCMTGQRGSTCSGCVHNLVAEQREGNIAFEATLSSSFTIACTNE